MKKVFVHQLAVGMYVGMLDRPWLETPFLFQGFRITSKKQIEELNRYCDYVFIDLEKTNNFDPALSLRAPPAHARTLIKSILPRRKRNYEQTIPVEQEFHVALDIHTKATQVVRSMYDDVRMGKSIDTQGAKQLVSQMVDSIVRNPDAQMLLAQLKTKDEYTATHSLNVCIFSLAFGRHLGMAPERLNEIGVGALLHDLGKVRVPLEVLNKPGKLTPNEFEIMKQHPVYGRDILAHSKGLSSNVMDIAMSHHERLNGSGYPRGLTADSISLFGRMVAIVDTYDAMTSRRVYHDGVNVPEAMRTLFDLRKKTFDQQLVEEFIQCMGIFPVGSVVELTSGDIGIVLSSTSRRRLKPKVLLIKDRNNNYYLPPRVLDLALFEFAGQAEGFDVKQVVDGVGAGVNIHDYLKPGMLGP